MKIGKKTNIIIHEITDENPNYIVAEELDNDYTDITSIENWVFIGEKLVDDINIVINGIKSIISEKGWSGLTSFEKELSAKYFAVNKNLRDEVLNDDQQRKSVDKLFRNQLGKRKFDFQDFYTNNSDEIIQYLKDSLISNDVRNVNLSKINMGSVTTNSNTWNEIPNDNFQNVSIGKYFLNFNCSLRSGRDIETRLAIFINNQIINSSEILREFSAGGGSAHIRNTVGWSNFPLTIESTSDVSIRWRTTGSSIALNRSFSLIKI